MVSDAPDRSDSRSPILNIPGNSVSKPFENVPHIAMLKSVRLRSADVSPQTVDNARIKRTARRAARNRALGREDLSLNISVFGCGHIGLIIGSCLSTIGHKTICADLSEPKVNALNQGQLPFYEPHLIDVVNQGFVGNSLVFTTDVARAADASDAIFVCVDTHHLENGEIDLSAIESVARVIADNSRSLKFVVVAETMTAEQ